MIGLCILFKVKAPVIVTIRRMWNLSSTFDRSGAAPGNHFVILIPKSNTEYWVQSRKVVGTILDFFLFLVNEATAYQSHGRSATELMWNRRLYS